jgi:hypothetical protein
MFNRFAKERIAIAPNNPSVWNYLRGVLDHAKIPYSKLQAFVLPYSLPQPPLGTPPEIVDLESPLPSKDSQLPCVAAIEFMADIHEAAGGDDSVKAVEVGYALHEFNTYLTYCSLRDGPMRSPVQPVQLLQKPASGYDRSSRTLRHGPGAHAPFGRSRDGLPSPSMNGPPNLDRLPSVSPIEKHKIMLDSSFQQLASLKPFPQRNRLWFIPSISKCRHGCM